jgi:hypothetical protein
MQYVLLTAVVNVIDENGWMQSCYWLITSVRAKQEPYYLHREQEKSYME